MRKFALFCLLLSAVLSAFLAVLGCSGRQTADSVGGSDSVAVLDSLPVDTLEAIIEEQSMPKAADELFDDFFFNFASNKRLQFRRIAFPLHVFRNDSVRENTIARRQWRMDHFFMRQDYYTLILDSPNQMELLKDTTVSHVVVEKIDLEHKSVKQYVFDRQDGLWMMTSINHESLWRNRNASFLKFYNRFAADSLFQIESMNDFVTFTAPDPDDDFNSITGIIVPEQWPMFRPSFIPSGELYNIIYGHYGVLSNRKILVVRGIANGLEMEMTFRYRDGKWLLMKFNT